jgi:hypothetical protein
MPRSDKPRHFRMAMHGPDVDTGSARMAMHIIPHTPEGEIIPSLNREAWMTAFAEAMRPYFERAGLAIPTKLRFGIGRLLGGKTDAIGRCHPHTWSRDGTAEITVDLSQDDSRTVATTVVHEMIHAALECKHGHGNLFRRVMGHVGLVGNATATEPSLWLIDLIDNFIAQHGIFPHASMSKNQPRRRKKADRDGYLKVGCPICGWWVRMTRKMLSVAKPPCCNPACPDVGQEMLVQGDFVAEKPHPDQPQDVRGYERRRVTTIGAKRWRDITVSAPIATSSLTTWNAARKWC